MKEGNLCCWQLGQKLLWWDWGGAGVSNWKRGLEGLLVMFFLDLCAVKQVCSVCEHFCLLFLKIYRSAGIRRIQGCIQLQRFSSHNDFSKSRRHIFHRLQKYVTVPRCAELVDITQGERQKEVQTITTWPVVTNL